MGGIGIWQLLIVLLLVFMLFGTKRLKTLGSDLGETIKGFRNSMGSDDPKGDDNMARTASLNDANRAPQSPVDNKH
ncbi:twin-arginine translocase TatA/TatE family subunit [uncultured Pseudomonas sp.]|uniref:twin-arginine translocase TatA/TatE family subunit n=1 Tax=uncultured Pseudomonas sp. TaxID=114707 RepID=UPI0025D8193D|nr:twin-arginine translocase TatA/TatE family subunit [uncultured Pseudomonas sp.]